MANENSMKKLRELDKKFNNIGLPHWLSLSQSKLGLKGLLPPGPHRVYDSEEQAILVAKLKPFWKPWDPKINETDRYGAWSSLGFWIFLVPEDEVE